MNSRFCDNLVGIVEEYVQNTTPLRYICVAILLNQTHVLTAAHCVISNSTYHVRYKSGNVSVSTYDYNEVTDKWIHPNYNENILGCKGNDVAILKQTENATQLSNPEFIPVTVHDTATCKRAEENVNETYMHDNICASGNNISLKEGDTGSPAYVFNNDGKIILIGFLYCEVQLSEAIFANSTYPVAITNISTFIAWIQYLSIDTTIIESSQFASGY
ncbi:Trypsin [Popillia japonica]|uniref:Trypsin n=1 Tax=Popillia japonica TaxID=7064 RepID=A0AAW1HVV2_POPJA